MATLWGTLARSPGLEVGAVICSKGARVSTYGGKSLNISDDLLINPDIHEATLLKAWYKKRKIEEGSKVKSEMITKVGERGVAPNSPIVCISELNNLLMNDMEFLNNVGGPGRYFRVNAEINRIFSQTPLFYSACTECKKKVQPSDISGSGHYYCEKCQKNI